MPRDIAKEREATRERVRRYRERKKEGLTVTSAGETITPAIKTVTSEPVLSGKHIVTDGDIEALPEHLKERIALEMQIRAKQGLRIPLRKLQENAVRAYRHW